jgi:hypothetical protein
MLSFRLRDAVATGFSMDVRVKPAHDDLKEGGSGRDA